MAANESVKSVAAPTVPAPGSGNPSVVVTYKGDSDATLTLYAVPAGGGAAIPVGTASFLLNPGNNGQATAPVEFTTNTVGALPAGNYTFYVGVNNANPGLPDISAGPSSGSSFICFMQGTLIGTPDGAVVVEDLRPGDVVLTADGRSVRVRFVGRQAVMPIFGLPEARNPILIRAGALADNIPARDLRVSAHHGIVVDGMLCFARALVNGLSILTEAAPADLFTYYAVETTAHEVLLAEGAPAESFCDHVPRERFDNYAEFQALFPEGREIGEMELPHAKSRRQIPAATLARLDARAAALYGETERVAA